LLILFCFVSAQNTRPDFEGKESDAALCAATAARLGAFIDLGTIRRREVLHIDRILELHIQGCKAFVVERILARGKMLAYPHVISRHEMYIRNVEIAGLWETQVVESMWTIVNALQPTPSSENWLNVRASVVMHNRFVAVTQATAERWLKNQIPGFFDRSEYQRLVRRSAVREPTLAMVIEGINCDGQQQASSAASAASPNDDGTLGSPLQCTQPSLLQSFASANAAMARGGVYPASSLASIASPSSLNQPNRRTAVTPQHNRMRPEMHRAELLNAPKMDRKRSHEENNFGTTRRMLGNAFNAAASSGDLQRQQSSFGSSASLSSSSASSSASRVPKRDEDGDCVQARMRRSDAMLEAEDEEEEAAAADEEADS
jgi:hypothetical protein